VYSIVKGTAQYLGRYKYEYMTTPNERCDGTNERIVHFLRSLDRGHGLPEGEVGVERLSVEGERVRQGGDK
jgi:hypothetical protein